MEVIKYSDLNTRQKEIYNFQKVSAVFSDYGFVTIKLSDDWCGADFIALHFDQQQQFKVQLKGNLSFAKKYEGKDLHICFHDKKSDAWYLYPHDKLLKVFIKSKRIGGTESWSKKGSYFYSNLSEFSKSQLVDYKL